MIPKVIQADKVYRHDRGWGYELWYANTEKYCGKVLVVEQGKKGSLHSHLNKEETMLCIQGWFRLKLIDSETAEITSVVLTEGDSITLKPGQAHQIINYGIKDCHIVEFSTKHEEKDSYRIEKGN